MPPDADHDVLTDPPREPASPFELAARRIVARWLDAGRCDATADDLRLAAEFLRTLGVTLEPLPGCDVLVIEADGAAVMSREAAVVHALRRLAALDAQRGGRSMARAA
jgi:hypothetical protein